jgi:hypothetical protein
MTMPVAKRGYNIGRRSWGKGGVIDLTDAKTEPSSVPDPTPEKVDALQVKPGSLRGETLGGDGVKIPLT